MEPFFGDLYLIKEEYEYIISWMSKIEESNWVDYLNPNNRVKFEDILEKIT